LDIKILVGQGSRDLGYGNIPYHALYDLVNNLFVIPNTLPNIHHEKSFLAHPNGLYNYIKRNAPWDKLSYILI
jgi:hypothetical protein